MSNTKPSALFSPKNIDDLQLNIARREQILQLVRETVLEGMYRRAAVMTRAADFEDFLQVLIIKVLDTSPDVWMHQHLMGKFVETINDKQQFTDFLMFVTNQLKSQFKVLGVTTEEQVASCHYSMLAPVGGNRLDNELVLHQATRDNWPTSDKVQEFLTNNSIALSLAMIQQHCLLREIMAWSKKIVEDNKARYQEAPKEGG